MHLSSSFNKRRPECFKLSSQKNANEINLSFSPFLSFFSFCPQKEKGKPSRLQLQEPKANSLLLHVSSPASRKIFPISEGQGHSEGCPWPLVTARFSWLGAAEGAPQRGRLSLETCCQQPDELAGNVRGSLQMPRKPSCWVTFRLGGPWHYQGFRWPPAADWEVAIFSTSELEKAALGIILGTDSHENLQELIGGVY